jgi:hypothetical protein
MSDLEARLLDYAFLSPGEQQAVEREVEACPRPERARWAALLRDMQGLSAVVRAARLLRAAAAAPGDEVLACYVADEALAPLADTPRAAALRRAFDRLEERMATEASVRARYEAFRARREAATSSFDAVAQFEALSGHRLDDMPEAPLPTPERSSPTPNEAPASPACVPTRSASTPERTERRPLASYVLVAVLALVLAYAALWGASRLTTSALDRLATVDVETDRFASYAVGGQAARQAPPGTASPGTAPSAIPPPGDGALGDGGTPGDSVSADVRFVQALHELRAAHTTMLGLFPRYDAARLTRAEALLEAVISAEARGSFLATEARWYLGKVKLAQGEVEPARMQFKTVAQQSGHHAREAVELLVELQRVAPAPAPEGFGLGG